MVRVEKERRVAIPYGTTNSMSIYFNDVLYDSIFNIKVYKYLNNVWGFEGEVPDSTKADTNLLRGKEVKIFFNNTLLLKGNIENSTYNTANTTMVSGIGSVAYELRQKTLSQNVENETFFDNKTSTYIINSLASLNNDGSSPWIVTTNHEDNYPGIFVRADNENKLSAVMNTIKACKYDWYESWGVLPYNDNQLNVAAQKGSLTSTYTFEVSGDDQNSIQSDRTEDRDKLWNDITVLGFGEGINQLRSRTYHATTNRTNLTSAMTKSGTETINVDSTSDFDASGSLWIGCEKVSYTGKTATTFTGITRSVAFMSQTNVTESYIHNEDIEVYDAQYTQTSAQTDSSIGDNDDTNDANWGLNEQTVSDNSIIDQNTLDKVAQNLLAEHQSMPVEIVIEPMEIYDTMPNVTLGDVITVNDPDTGSSNAEFRIVGIEIGLEDAVEFFRVTCSNSYKDFIDVLQRVEEENKRLAQYMRGSANVITVQSYENAEYSATPEDKAMKMKFRIWDKTIAIQDGRLDFKILPFRAYADSSQTASGGTSHSHSLSGVSSNANNAISDFTGGSANITGTSLSTAGYTNIPSSAFSPGQNTLGVLVTFAFRETTAAGAGRMHFRVYDGSSYYPSAGSTAYYNSSGDNQITIFVPGNHNGNTLTPSAILGAGSSSPGTFDTSTGFVPIATHTHGFTAQTTATESAHTHSITMSHGIFEDSDNPTVKVQIGDDDDWNATKSYINSGAAYSYGTHNDVDISTELKTLMGDLSTTKRIRVQFEPQGAGNTCRIEANADLFTFLGSQ